MSKQRLPVPECPKDEYEKAKAKGCDLHTWEGYLEYYMPPYSYADYARAKERGLDLDDWGDYVAFYHLGEEETYD